MRLLSRLFPLPVEMNNSNVSFTTNTVKLDGARLQAGKSDLKLSGEITSIRRALLRGGKLKGKLAIESDYIDCNELIQAINAGVLFSEENEKSRHTVQADNNPEVFPFIIQMDRYKVAVGGTQQMDMSFNYHISVLKSPVPFKLGIDIKGTPEKFDYDITKCRYKDLFSPSKTNRLDTVKINVRKQIYDSVRKQMNLLSSEPESIRPSANLALEQVAEKPEE